MENANEAFKLQGQDDSFKDRAYSIFGSLTSSLSSSLNSGETRKNIKEHGGETSENCNKNENGAKISKRYREEHPSNRNQLKLQKHDLRHRLSHNSSQEGRQSDFKKPYQPARHSRHGKQAPNHVINPEKYTKYRYMQYTVLLQ